MIIDDNDILFLDVEKLVNTAQRFRLTLVKMAEMTKCAVMKAFQN